MTEIYSSTEIDRWVRPADFSAESWLPDYYQPEFLELDSQIKEYPEDYYYLSDLVGARFSLPTISNLEGFQWVASVMQGKASVSRIAKNDDGPSKLFELPPEAILIPRFIHSRAIEPVYWSEAVYEGEGVGVPSILCLERKADQAIPWIVEELKKEYCQLQLQRAASGSVLPTIGPQEVLNLRIRKLSPSEQNASSAEVLSDVVIRNNQERIESLKAQKGRSHLLTGSTFEERREQFEEYLLSDQVQEAPIAFVEPAYSGASSDLFIVNPLLKTGQGLQKLIQPQESDSEAAEQLWREWYFDNSTSAVRLFHTLYGSPSYALPRTILKRILPALLLSETEKVKGALSKVLSWATSSEKKLVSSFKLADINKFKIPILAFQGLLDLFPDRSLEKGIEALSDAREVLRELLGKSLPDLSENDELIEASLTVNRKAFRPVLAVKIFRDEEIAGVYLIAGEDQFDDPAGVAAKLEALGKQLVDILEPPTAQVEEITRRESLRRLSWFQHQINGPLMRGIKAVEDVREFLDMHEEIASSLIPSEERARKRALMTGTSLESHQLESRLRVAEKAFQDLRGLNYQIRKLRNAQASSPKETVDVGRVLEELLIHGQDSLRSLRTGTNILTRKTVLGDRQTLRDALDEVVNNSIRELRERGTSNPEIAIEVWESDNSVCFEIRDNGLPIEATLMDDVLEEDASTYSSLGKGSGLGLAIVKETFRAHRGRCDLKENRDSSRARVAGVTFSASLPIHEESNLEE